MATSSRTDDKAKQCALTIPRFLMPADHVHQKRWAVIACDQYTAEKDYWHQVYDYVGESPSTLHMVLPEAFLDKDNQKQKINTIQRTMRAYSNGNVFTETGPMLVYIERTLCNSTVRPGLMTAIDLEQYSYDQETKSLVRPTEGTVPSRIPPRVAIRKGAPLELSHVLILFDDPRNLVFDYLERKRLDLPICYETELMQNGGYLRGFQVSKDDFLDQIFEYFLELAKNHSFLFCIGDGNHSLGAAKSIWDSIKPQLTASERETHPARFALVELVNLHSPALEFNSIHRFVRGVSSKKMVALLEKRGFTLSSVTGQELPQRPGENPDHGYLISQNSAYRLHASNAIKPIVSIVQEFLDEITSDYPNMDVDYIHGHESLKQLVSNKQETQSKSGDSADGFKQLCGFLLPPIQKKDFFAYIDENGSYVRKAFSLGEAQDKRYYYECRCLWKQ